MAAVTKPSRDAPLEATPGPHFGRALDSLRTQARRTRRAVDRLAATTAGNASAHYYLARGLQQRGELQQAEEEFRRAIHHDPTHVDAHLGLAEVLRRRGAADEALALCREALHLEPVRAETHVALATLLLKRGDRRGAAEHLLHVLRSAPEHADAQLRLAMLLQDEGRVAEALTCYDRALAKRPFDPQSRLLRGLLALQRGDWQRGWREYEWRHRIARRGGRRAASTCRRWDGSSPRDKTLLVRAEGNLADDLLFASCLPELIAASGRCLLECDGRLAALFRRSFPQATVVPPGPSRAAIAASPDAEIHLGSLPLHLRQTDWQFPVRGGYLVPDVGRRARWEQRLTALGGGLKVGLDLRGTGIRDTGLLRRMPGVVIVDVLEFCRPRRAPDEAAALLAALDLVITGANPTAHLAGALGAPTWTLLGRLPSWRWMLNRETTPWYPGMGLFRETSAGGWQLVLADVAGKLRGAARAAGLR